MSDMLAWILVHSFVPSSVCRCFVGIWDRYDPIILYNYRSNILSHYTLESLSQDPLCRPSNWENLLHSQKQSGVLGWTKVHVLCLVIMGSIEKVYTRPDKNPVELQVKKPTLLQPRVTQQWPWFLRRAWKAHPTDTNWVLFWDKRKSTHCIPWLDITVWEYVADLTTIV